MIQVAISPSHSSLLPLAILSSPLTLAAYAAKKKFLSVIDKLRPETDSKLLEALSAVLRQGPGLP